jgi:hypothetical protein
LESYLETFKTKLRNGYQKGGQAGAQKSAAKFWGMRDLRGTNPDYFVATRTLPKFELSTLLFPRPREIYSAPLLLLSESMTVGDRPRASVSLSDVLYDERYDGVTFAGIEQGEEIARYLQLAFLSSLAHHALFLLDGQYGIEREVVHRESLAALPVLPWHQLSSKQRAIALKLSDRLQQGMDQKLAAEIDRFLFDIFELSQVQRDAVADTLATAVPTAVAKRESTRTSSSAERQRFAEIASLALAGVLQASGKRALIRTRDDLTVKPWRLLQVDVWSANESVAPDLAQLPTQRLLDAADGAAASLVIIEINKRTRVVAILDAYRHWTRTRARMLAVALVENA